MQHRIADVRHRFVHLRNDETASRSRRDAADRKYAWPDPCLIKIIEIVPVDAR
jgi:hypothetical protein